ncbi:MAG TPA: Na+/H+ antiporter NhaA, partial [Actinobacteria bacterium]|nr:Na+/H+ antiporter NhaA [Actinomycetota bacterium]
TVGEWAADGLLAIFFFVVGLELKHELTLGTLSRPAQAAVPIAAALGGMAVPALIYIVINEWSSGGSPTGWGIPMATDIAFALAVLAIVGRRLPVALRAFLLTLAVVDDLGAITVIAVFYTDHVSLTWLAASLACLAAYAWAQHLRITAWWLYVPVALLAWGFMHASGVHATLAGVALGLLTRARPDSGEDQGPADRIQHRIHPLSAGIAVPIFALTAAGIPLAGINILDALTTPIALGIALGLVVGKPIGIAGTAWLLARFTRASLAPTITWADVAAVGVLAGVGFTVALLIAELAYEGTALLADAKLAVLVASLIAGAFASIVLLARGRHYAQLPADPD